MKNNKTMKNKHAILFMVLAFCFSTILHSQNIISQVDKKFNNIKKLTIQGNFCDVVVSTSQSDQIHFKGKIDSEVADLQIQILYKQEKDVLKVWIKRPNVINKKVRGKLEFIVPSITGVKIENSTGNVSIDGIVKNDILVETLRGNVNVRNFEANAKVKSSSGNIDIRESIGNLDVSSISGSISISAQNGLIKAITTTGVVTIIDVVGDMNVKSSASNVSFKNTKGKINVETFSGKIEGDNVLLTNNSSFVSISGSIIFDLTNDFSALSFDITSTTGKINVFGQNHDKKFVKDGGRIKIKSSSVSGNQKYF